MRGVIIVDGTNLVHRAYAVASRSAADSGAILAATVAGGAILFSRLTRDYPEAWASCRHVAAFDGGGDSGRKAKYPDYKREREHNGAIAEACGALAESMARLGYAVYRDLYHEADDLIASAWRAARADGDEAIVVSTDGDFWQLIESGTTIRVPKHYSGEPRPGDPARYRDVGVIEHVAKFEFPPRFLPDYKALAGDASDGYPGLPGIGHTFAKQLVSTFGSLDRIFANAASVRRDNVRAALLADGARERAYLFRDLATLQRDAALPPPLRPSRP